MQFSKLFRWNTISTAPMHGFFSATFLFVLLFGGYLNSAYAEDPGLLTIKGNLKDSSEKVIQLDLKTLMSMEATTITATVPWIGKAAQFKGVRINSLLKSVGAKSNEFEAVAVNDYKFTLTGIDFDKYPVIVAYEKNGELLNVRKLGPLLIMFPFDDFPELLNERNKAASVWQLIELRIL